MTETLLVGGSYSVPDSHPYEVHFQGVSDILLPFQGTIVVPAGAEPDFAALGMHQWMFLSLRHPLATAQGQHMIPALRGFDNQPLRYSGAAIFLVAGDDLLLEELTTSSSAETGTLAGNPGLSEGIGVSVRPRYLLLLLEGLSLPHALAPLSREHGFSLCHSSGGEPATPGLQALRQVLSQAPLSGRLLAFDHAGRQTDAYSSLLTLGFSKPISLPGGAQADHVYVQFVDIYGNALALDEPPLSQLACSPTPQPAGDAGQRTYRLSFAVSGGGDRILGLSRKSSAAAPAQQRYLYHFLYATYWPGYLFSFRPINAQIGSAQIEPFNLGSFARTGSRFVRICLFHPAQVFQTTVGGPIELRSLPSGSTVPIFADNGLRLFSSHNALKIYNSGQDFFADYQAEVNALGAGDALWQSNWRASAHLHLPGSMRLRLIDPGDYDAQLIVRQLEHMRSHSVIATLESADESGADTGHPLMLAARRSDGAAITSGFAVRVQRQEQPGVEAATSHKGFVRPGAIYALQLQGPASPLPTHMLRAVWKTSLGNISEVTFEHLARDVDALPELPSLPAGAITLDIDKADPPHATLRRTMTLAAIQSAVPGLQVVGEQPYLLVLNLSAGSSRLLPLSPPSGAAPQSPDTLGTLDEDLAQGLPAMLAEDVLAIALVGLPDSEGDFLLQAALRTRFRMLAYSHAQHLQAHIPLHPAEAGGLLRAAIARGVTLRALFWEQSQGLLAGGPDVATGHTTNQEISAILNRPVAGSYGYALIDRSTRSFGSWHHKATAIVKQVDADMPGRQPLTQGIAYLGGIDLATGRWDTQSHARNDPDRPGGLWYDIQIKIAGDAAWDVLRNFRQRWRAMSVFMDQSNPLSSYQPANESQVLREEVKRPVTLPDETLSSVAPGAGQAFVQINRTIPPWSCFSNPLVEQASGLHVDERQGEFASLASYKHAIASARKFIIINDQYFYSLELALSLHQALIADAGPAFLVIVVPQTLSEDEKIDPLLYKLRQKAIQILLYGGAEHNGQISANPASDAIAPLRSRVALLTPTNRAGDEVYVHSKHIIVDDVWMTVGSANINNRSLTYDLEINAACVGEKLYKGSTSLVRSHRIEICRQLLGLPRSYSALLQDPFAVFRLFKAIEQQQDQPAPSLHPIRPMIKWLDVQSIPINTSKPFDEKIYFVATMDINDPSFAVLQNVLLDPHGTTRDGESVGYLGRLFRLGSAFPFATARVSCSFSPECETPLRAALGRGEALDIELHTRIGRTDAETGAFSEEGPFLWGTFALAIAQTTGSIVMMQAGAPTNQVFVTISLTDPVSIEAVVVNQAGATTLCRAISLIDPGLASPPMLYGTTVDIALFLEP